MPLSSTVSSTARTALSQCQGRRFLRHLRAPWSNANVDIWLFWSRFRSVGSSTFRRIHAYCNPHRNQLEVMVFIEPRIDLMTTTDRSTLSTRARVDGTVEVECRDIDGRQVVMARTVLTRRRGPFPGGMATS